MSATESKGNRRQTSRLRTVVREARSGFSSTTSGVARCGASGETSQRSTLIVTVGGICPGSPMKTNRLETSRSVRKSAQVICQASSISKMSYASTKSTRPSFATVPIITEPSSGSSFLSVTTTTSDGKFAGGV